MRRRFHPASFVRRAASKANRPSVITDTHARAEGAFEPQHAQPGEHEQHQRDDGRFQDLTGRAEHAARFRPARRASVRGQVRDEIGQEARGPQAPRRDHDVQDHRPRGRLLPG
jgi:hypothetical protein